MKLEILLFVLLAMALSSSAGKIKGRRSNIKSEQLLGNDYDGVNENPAENEKVRRVFKADSSKGRHWNKKGNTAQASPPNVVIIGTGFGSGGGYSPPQYPEYETIDSSGTVNSTGFFETYDYSRAADTDDDDDNNFDNEDEETPIKNRKQQNTFKLKKINGRKESPKFVVSAKPIIMPNFENSGSVRKFKNTNNEMKKFKQIGNGNVKRKSNNSPVRLIISH